MRDLKILFGQQIQLKWNEGRYIYNKPTQEHLENNDILIYSIHNEVSSVITKAQFPLSANE